MITIKRLTSVICASAIVSTICMMSSCSKDENKISISDGYIETGDATNITATTATITGGYNFYSTVGYLFEKLTTNFSSSDTLDTAYIRKFAHIYKQTQEVVFPKDCPQYIDVALSVVDVKFRSAGFIYSCNQDFYGCVKSCAGEFKHDSFSETITGLKPATQYWYKTYIQAEPTLFIQNEKYGIKVYAALPDSIDIFDYYAYGDTKSFTTLNK